MLSLCSEGASVPRLPRLPSQLVKLSPSSRGVHSCPQHCLSAHHGPGARGAGRARVGARVCTPAAWTRGELLLTGGTFGTAAGLRVTSWFSSALPGVSWSPVTTGHLAFVTVAVGTPQGGERTRPETEARVWTQPAVWAGPQASPLMSSDAAPSHPSSPPAQPPSQAAPGPRRSPPLGVRILS